MPLSKQKTEKLVHEHTSSGDFEELFDYNIIDQEDLSEIKWVLQENKKVDCDIGLPFNTNILKIALNLKETKIASILAYQYKVLIYEEMIIRAVKTD